MWHNVQRLTKETKMYTYHYKELKKQAAKARKERKEQREAKRNWN